MPRAYSLEIPSAVKYLVQAGLYEDATAVLKDAVRQLLVHRPDYRLEMAIAAYRAGDISLGKAAEMAGLCVDSMKEDFCRLAFYN